MFDCLGETAASVVRLVRIREGQGAAPLIVAPDILASPLYLRGALSGLPTCRPVHGLSVIGPTKASLEHLAQISAEAVTAAVPAPVYHLAGHCFGGIFAYALAVALRARGAHVGTCALIEAAHPPAPAQRVLGRIRRLGRQEDPLVLSAPGYASIPMAPHPAVLHPVMRGLYDALIRYRPPVSDLHLTILRARDGSRRQPPDLGWRGRTTGGLTCLSTPGTHLGILKETDLAQQLGRALDAALADRDCRAPGDAA